MRKVLIIAGLILLLAGLALARPVETRNMIDGIGNRDAHDRLMNTYNGSYERSSDALNDNLEVVAYGVAMIGIIVMILGLAGKNDTADHLLYAGGDKQNISPRALEKCITNPTMSPEPGTLPPGMTPGMSPTPSGQGITSPGDGFELPDLEPAPRPSPLMASPQAQGSNQGDGFPPIEDRSLHDTGATGEMRAPVNINTPGNHPFGTAMEGGYTPNVGNDTLPFTPADRTMVPGMYDPGMTDPPVRTRNFDPMTGEPLRPGVTRPRPPNPHGHHWMNQNSECTLRCPNCDQIFILGGNIKEVICPRCGKRFMNRGPAGSR